MNIKISTYSGLRNSLGSQFPALTADYGYTDEYDENNNSMGVGFGGSLIPVWGSARSAIAHFQQGNIWRGIGNSALAISDVLLVKSAATAVGKGAWKLGLHSWRATRKWLGKIGYAASGQPVHHWAISQKNYQPIWMAFMGESSLESCNLFECKYAYSSRTWTYLFT